jgi:hypothetical protein
MLLTWRWSSRSCRSSRLRSNVLVRAAATGELRPIEKRLDAVPVSPKLAEFIRRVRSDGTFARAVDEIGREAPDLATT